MSQFMWAGDSQQHGLVSVYLLTGLWATLALPHGPCMTMLLPLSVTSQQRSSESPTLSSSSILLFRSSMSLDTHGRTLTIFGAGARQAGQGTRPENWVQKLQWILNDALSGDIYREMELNAFLYLSVSYLKSDEAFDPFSTVVLAGPLLTSALLSKSHQYSSLDSLSVTWLLPLKTCAKYQALTSMVIPLQDASCNHEDCPKELSEGREDTDLCLIVGKVRNGALS